MSEQELIDALHRLPDDSEAGHLAADRLLLAFLRSEGHAAAADAFEDAKERIGFWYA